MVQAAKQGRKNAIGNFYPDLVDLKVMRTFAKKNKIKLDADGEDAEKYALALTLHFREVEKDPNEFAACETCGGESPASYDACPFCGLEAGAEDDEEEGDEGDEADEVDEEEADVEVVDEDEESPPESSEQAKDDEEEAPPPPAPKPKEVKLKGKGPKLAASTALATTASSAMSVKLLDEAIDRVYALKIAGAESFWKLGNEILQLHRDGLWKQRLDEKGTQRYASFEAFCTHELQMSGTYALDIMKVARDFTKEQIAAMGRKKSMLVWKAAPEDRKEIAEKAAAGATVREVAKDVKASREKHKIAEKSERSRAGAKGAKAKAEKKAAKEAKALPEKITIAQIEGMKTVKLYAKPATMKNLKLEDCKRAKTIKDQPIGKMDLANGVAMTFSIVVDKSGALAVKVTTQRESVIA